MKGKPKDKREMESNLSRFKVHKGNKTVLVKDGKYANRNKLENGQKPSENGMEENECLKEALQFFCRKNIMENDRRK